LVATTQLTPQQLWAAFSEPISSRPGMRIRRPGHKTYDRPRRWTPQRPSEVAAVLLYGEDRRTRCLVFDFDVGRRKDGKKLAAAEANAFARQVRDAGGRPIIDRSPVGGHHVYVRLANPRSVDVVERLMLGMRKHYATLDILPMVNAKTGCIRPPGAKHPAGGYQQLVTPVQEAYDALARPNSDEVWRFLVAMAGTVSRTKKVATTKATIETFVGAQRWRGRQKYALGTLYELIARTGRYDAAKHPTASHARMAVIFAAFHQGWLLGEVIDAARPGGRWAGLHRLFGNQVISTQLPHEWGIAEALIRGGGSLVRRSDTRESIQTRPLVGTADRDAEYAWLREWWTAMRLCERRRYSGRPPATRLVLRALAAMAQRRGSRYLAIGVRSLALAANLDHSTVARVLRELREEPDPLIDLMDGQRGGDRPDVYQLCVPEEFERAARLATWRPGKLEAIHPAFLDLGVPAAFVYEALGESREPLRTCDVVDVAMLSRSATSAALRTLGEMGLAERSPGGWVRGPISLDDVAREIGADERFRKRVQAYKDEREAFRKAIWKAPVDPTVAAPVGEPPVDLWATGVREPPADQPADDVIVLPSEQVIDLERQHEEAVMLLEREVGAVAVPP
jgi:hypothetical protein